MAEVITDIVQLTPDWLTETLRRAGVLPDGQVETLEMETTRPFASLVSRLTVTYSDSTPADAPHRLFFKLANPETHQQHPERGRHEVEFYQSIPAEDYSNLPVPRCYDAAVSDDGFHLLLDDLGTTRTIIPHPFPPSTVRSEQAVDALARLHGYWWNDERLGVRLGSTPDRKAVFGGNEVLFRAFAEFLGEALPAERRAVYERVQEAAPKLHERLTKGNLTLIHGDAHAWNFLYPLNDAGTAALVDWEAWDVDIGTFDLAYLITLFWFPAHRARAEMPLVRRYHQQLESCGVVGYSWQDCWHDYRHSVIRLLFQPVWWWHEQPENELWAELWWPRLERVLCAFEDLQCEELI